MNYRNANFQDINELTGLFEGYRTFYRKESDYDGAKHFLTERLKNKDSVIFVAETENVLVGFAQLYPLFSSTRMKKSWLLNDLFVNPSFRKMGISIGLINMAKELVKNTLAFGMCLETEKTNDVGNNLYQKTGFTLNSVSNYYEWTV